VLPGLIAPAAAVAVAETLGWRAVFLGLAPLVALAAALVLPSVGRHASASIAVAEAERATEPAPARAKFVAALAVRALVVFAFFGVESFLPLSLARVRGIGPAHVAAILTISALAWTAGAFVQARAAARFPAPTLAASGALALLAGIACATSGLFEGTPTGIVLGGWTLASLGMGIAYNTATASAMEATRSGGEGVAGAALGITDAIASSVSTALGGWLLAAVPLAPGVTPGFVVAAFVLAGLVGAASLAPARRLRAAGSLAA
jgi:predicted MFS family arabinose efflux permease